MKRCFLAVVAALSITIAAHAQPAPLDWGAGTKVLMVGGTWAHNYQLYDNKWDADLLAKNGITAVHYTENAAVEVKELPKVDVLILSANGGFDQPAVREACSNFVNAGKGLVLLHSGSFYAGKWQGFYDNYVGGGAHDHDGPGEFEETVLKDHPVVRGLPKTFKITDELYHIKPAPGASPMEVLVEASKPGGEKYPSVWIVHYGKARIVSIALGHDKFPRQSPEFGTLLVNAVKWAAGQ